MESRGIDRNEKFLISNDSSFSQYKICVDIRRGSLERGVKRQWGNRRRRFSVLSDAESSANIIIYYYLVLFRLSTDP